MSLGRIAGSLAWLAPWLLLAAASAAAQPIYPTVASVELLAAQAPLIVRGVIEEVEEAEPANPFRRMRAVTFHVRETIRGLHAERLRFVHDGDFSSHRLEVLRDDRRELLLMLEEWPRTGGFTHERVGYPFARFPHVVQSVLLLGPERVAFPHTEIPPLSARRQPLTTSQEVIDAIREFLEQRRDGAPPRIGTAELPPEMRGVGARAVLFYPLEEPAEPPPRLTYAEFRARYAAEPPAEKKPPYLRNQSGYVGVYALEWMAADCDAILRAVIEESCFVAATDDPTGPARAARLRVLETIKGEVPEELGVFITDSRDLEPLRRDRREILFFLRREPLEEPAAALGWRTRANLWDDSVIVLDPREAEVLTSAMLWYREPGEILPRLRAWAKSTQAEPPELEDRRAAYPLARKAPPVFSFRPPAALAEGTSVEGNQYAVLYLPVDAELERNALRWIASPNPSLRWLGARALHFFYSEEHAERLKPLLEDDSLWSREETRKLLGTHYRQPEGEEVFLVRVEAWRVLSGWGYSLPQPEFTP